MFNHLRADFARCGDSFFSRFKEVITNPAMWAVGQYRFQRWVRQSFPRPVRWVLTVVTIPSSVLAQVLTQIQISPAVDVGPGLYLPHTGHIVIGSGTTIGSNCTIAHGVTIGHGGGGNSPASKNPRIGDRVYIGPGAILIGDIDIGCDALIGAGAVVIRSVPDRAVVVGNPGRIISRGGSFKLIDYPGMDEDPGRSESLSRLNDLPAP